MKSIVALFLLVSNVCFSCTDQVWNIRYEVIKLCNEMKHLQALYLLQNLVDLDTIPNIDKVHYLVFKHKIDCILNLYDEYKKDCIQLSILNDKFQECVEEFKAFEWLFYSPGL